MSVHALKLTGHLRRPLRGRGAGLRFLALFLVLSAVIGGCANGTYPLDIFYEMHYQQSYQAHEPPRLSAPVGAVPITGRGIARAENPIPGEGVEEGARLFATNCVFCHGEGAKGDGPVVKDFMIDKYGYKPIQTLSPDLTSGDPGHAQAIGDLEVFAWISNGAIVMPPFEKLLSVDERWMLVNYIRSLSAE